MSEHWCGDVPPPADMPPTETTFTDWEPIIGPKRRRLVATRFSFFRVHEYTEVIDEPVVGYFRFKHDVWVQPYHNHAEYPEPPLAAYTAGEPQNLSDYAITTKGVGPFTYGRRTRQFRGLDE